MKKAWRIWINEGEGTECHMAKGFSCDDWTNGQCIMLTFHFVRAMCTTVRRLKAWVFSVSAFTSELHSTRQCKPNRGYQLMQQKVQEVERKPCRSIMHLFSKGLPVLSWLTCALGKQRHGQGKTTCFQCTYQVWYCSGAVFVLHPNPFHTKGQIY